MNKWKRVSGFWVAIATFIAWQLGSGISAAQHPLEAPWQQTDIGNVGIVGSASESSDGDLIINAAGSDIWGTADSFHFVYQTLYDGEISSNSPWLENTHPFAKIGLMIRLTLDPGSPEVIVDMKPDHTVEFMTRSTQDGETTFIAGLNHSGALRLVRSNGVVTAIVCAGTCEVVGSTPFPTGPAIAGAAVTSHDPAVLNHAMFPASPPHVQTVPEPWTAGDVGNVGLRGSAFFQNNAFTVSGAGADIWGTSDAYQGVTSTLMADGSIVARVTAENAANTFAKAGVVATWLGRTVILDIRPNGMIEFMARAAQNGQMAFIAGSGSAFPVWLKLERVGDEFAASIRPDDSSPWQFIGSTSVSMATNIGVGLAVTSHDTSALNTSTFDNVVVSSAAPNDIDIGDVGVAGGVESSGLSARVSGGGADIWGMQDAFNYYYTSLINDGQMSAKVTGLDNTSPFAKAGIMIRASTDPSAAHVILDVKPDGGIEFMTRSATGASTTFLAGTARSFPVWLWLQRSGSTVTGYVIDGNHPTQVGSVSIDLPSDALIGLAVTSHQRGTLTPAFFEQISR